MHTTNSTLREHLGFDNLQSSWRDAEIAISDSDLRICNHPVMEAWEHPYMEHLARIAGSNGGRVLELGYGMGISAGYLQQQPIDAYVVVEANRHVHERAMQFAKTARIPATPLLGFWEDVTQAFPDESFDGILFDTYPLTEETIHCNHFPFFQEAMRLLKPGGVFTYYSDESKDFSPRHMTALRNAGFTDIRTEVSHIPTPEGCEYWQEKTMLAPVIRKPAIVRVVPASMSVSARRGVDSPFGMHLMVDCYHGDYGRLNDFTAIYDFLDTLPARVGMQKIAPPQMSRFTDCDIEGVTGITQIVTSHISLHTFARRGYASMDLYSCKPFDHQLVISALRDLFQISEQHMDVLVADRGIRYPAHHLFPEAQCE